MDGSIISSDSDDWKRGFDRVVEAAAERDVSITGSSKVSSSGERTLVLSMVFVPFQERGWGLGSRFINETLAWADENQVTVRLTPDPNFAGMNAARLERFWRKFGFIPNKGAMKDFEFRETLVRPCRPGPDIAPDIQSC